MTRKGDPTRSKIVFTARVRRLAALLLLALALPALALASHREPQKRTAAADERIAAAVVLKRADFTTGWKRTPGSPGDGGHFDCPGYDPDGSDLVRTGEAEADFEHIQGFPAVFSFANVFKSRAHAAASWTRGVKPAMATCLATVLQRGLQSEGMKVAVSGRGAIAFPKVAPRTAAYRIALQVTVNADGRTSRVPMTMHVIALGRGRAEAGLVTLGVGAGLSAADLRAFGGLLAQRLAAAKV
jgi:hypothetical protein